MTIDPAARPGLAGLLKARGAQVLQSRLDGSGNVSEGLRERKKRLTRQLISDTATGMFLEKGFDEVRVADVAAACGVSEKTVYNYFPTKESLLFDRFEDMEADVRRALGPEAVTASPVEAAVRVIIASLRWFADSDANHPFDPTMFRRFADLVQRTPALRAAQREMTDRVVQVAAEAMAARAGVNPADPEPQIAANAIIGLWRVQYLAMVRHAEMGQSAEDLREAVITEVQRAARLIDTGLWSFGLAVQGSGGREQLRLAAESANEARKQVLTAIRQARNAWRQVKADAHRHDPQAHREPRLRPPPRQRGPRPR